METKDKELSKALSEFRKQYPGKTSSDWQTFIIGWRAHVQTYLKNRIPSDVTNEEINNALSDVHQKTEGGWNVMRSDLRKHGMDILAF